MVLNTKSDASLSDVIDHTDLYFTAKEYVASGSYVNRSASIMGSTQEKDDKPVDKLKMVFLEGIVQNSEDGVPTTIL